MVKSKDNEIVDGLKGINDYLEYSTNLINEYNNYNEVTDCDGTLIIALRGLLRARQNKYFWAKSEKRNRSILTNYMIAKKIKKINLDGIEAKLLLNYKMMPTMLGMEVPKLSWKLLTKGEMSDTGFAELMKKL